LKFISRTIWFLSFISLFTDMASEMLYPVMPVFLKSLGYSVVFIGVLEGVAEAIAGFSKGYFGKLSDQQGRRVPFVQLGYCLSALSKPIMGFMTSIGIIFIARTADRFGKGIRTGARDAMLSDEATGTTKGKVFGFHRTMDTLGAVAGPSLALAYLYYNPGAYSKLFLWAFIPGVIAVLFSLLLKEKSGIKPTNEKVNFFSFTGYWKKSTPAYRKLVAALLVFAVVNSSDVFLLLMMKEKGASDTEVIGIYIFYNLIYALSAFPLGIAGDKIGLKKMLTAGLVLFAIVYAGFSLAEGTYVFLFLFALYGIYAAATEGISKALITSICKKEETATAIGTYTAYQSLATLIASTLAGWVWYTFGPEIVFAYAGIVTFIVAVVIYRTKEN